MRNWRAILEALRGFAARLPMIAWLGAVAVALALAGAIYLESSGPPFVALYDGLSPVDGGKVIAQLQKLSIPYQLQAAGNIILVPAPDLAQARLQLGATQVPGSDVATAWAQLEDAPMTASDLAQSTMATQALQLSLQQSIESMAGIRNAEVFLALPPDTPFLADQPKPAASVVIDADDAAAQAQGQAIANLVAGAVPGLAAAQVSVETNSGVAVYPAANGMTTNSQLATVAQVENSAAARVAGLLIPLVGDGNFQTDVSANLDFTQESTHQISYGPSHLIAHQISNNSTQSGPSSAAIGIPGALSNEPPPATTASTKDSSAQAVPNPPQQSSSNLDQTYVTDESDSDITKPAWAVNALAVSVVLNKAALGAVTPEQVKTLIAGAFAYPQVNVSVLSAVFAKPVAGMGSASLGAAIPPLAHGLLELFAAAALLFGLALPLGRRLGTLNLQALLPPPPPRPMPNVLPPRDFPELRAAAGENVPGVARLLQSWAEENE